MKILKKYCVASLIILILIGFANADDRRTDKSVLVIMTLNTEFLWDGVEPEEGQASFPWKFSQTEAAEHMSRIAEIIIRSNPDIVNLVEVENEEALNTFNSNFLAGRGYKAYFIKGKDTYTGQDVALLTRIDPEGMKIERDDRKGQSGTVSKSVSKNYFAKLTLSDNTKIVLIGIHFLAQPKREDRRLKREAQAEAIRSLAAEKQNEEYAVIVLGDFNDYDGEEGSRDHVNNMPVSNVLSIIKSMDVSEPLDDLINCASFAPKANRYTAFYDANENGEIDPPDEFTSIDHVLLSPMLAAKVETVEIPHYHDPRTVTDHFPVVVRLRSLDGSIPPPAMNVKIKSLLPNPVGNENQNEEITIINLGSQSVDLNGWKLCDLAGKTWLLDGLGTLNPGEEKTIKRDGQKMALNNKGDTIDLIDPNGNVLHTVTYARAEEEEVITPTIN